MANSVIMKDENMLVSLDIMRHHGLVTKGIMNKKKYFSFITSLKIKNPKGYKIKSIEGFYFDRSGHRQKLNGESGNIAQLVQTSEINSNQIKIQYIINYKISFGMTKTMKVTCNAVI